jgi:hypothetical protein
MDTGRGERMAASRREERERERERARERGGTLKRQPILVLELHCSTLAKLSQWTELFG